jgi:hypothetical protein
LIKKESYDIPASGMDSIVDSFLSLGKPMRGPCPPESMTFLREKAV